MRRRRGFRRWPLGFRCVPTISRRFEIYPELLEGVVDEPERRAITPSRALRDIGPCVQAALSPLPDQSGTVRESVTGNALLDTGAGATCVDIEAAKVAGLATVDSGPLASATDESTIVPIYAGHIDLGNGLAIDVRRAYGARLQAQSLIALIGRDAFAAGVLVYNGLDGSFSFSV